MDPFNTSDSVRPEPVEGFFNFWLEETEFA